MPSKPIRTFEEYRQRYFPSEVEAERVARLTPEELGQEWAAAAIKRVMKAVKKSMRHLNGA